MLVPLAGGLLVNAKRPDVAARVKPVLDKTSNLSLIVLMALQTVLNVRSVVAVFGTGILAGVVFLAAGYTGPLAVRRATHEWSWASEPHSGTSQPRSLWPIRASTTRTASS
jgi:predicted Na+-dependent transporter